MAIKRKPVDAVVIGVGWAGSIIGKELAQGVGVSAQLVVVQELELGLPAVDPVDALLVLLELACFAHAQGAIEDRHSYLA